MAREFHDLVGHSIISGTDDNATCDAFEQDMAERETEWTRDLRLFERREVLIDAVNRLIFRSKSSYCQVGWSRWACGSSVDALGGLVDRLDELFPVADSDLRGPD